MQYPADMDAADIIAFELDMAAMALNEEITDIDIELQAMAEQYREDNI